MTSCIVLNLIKLGYFICIMNILKLFFLTTSLISTNSHAVFQEIWQGYQVSKFHQSKMWDEKINEENFIFEQYKFDWQIFITPSYDNTFLDALFSFQSRETVTTGLTYGVRKSSYKFGTVSFQQEQLTYDLSNWEQSTLVGLPGDRIYGTKNSLTYTYDFLDKSSDIDFELAKINYHLGSLEAKSNIEKAFYDFFSIYIQAKLQVYTVRLTKEFVNESQRRVRQIQKRFKDGLSREVELLQAKSSLLNQQEALEKSRSSLKQNLAIIENLVGFKIKDSYFDQLNWQQKEFSSWKGIIREDKNLSVQVLSQRLKYSEKTLQRVNEQSGSKLGLTASYIMNDIDDDASKSFTNSFNGERYSKNIALTWTIPLGLHKREALLKKTAYQKKKNELDLYNLQDEVRVKKSALLDQIRYLETASKLSSNKIEISRKTLKEQNKLYLRGQSTFEEVVRAEEAYINSRLSEKRLLAEYDMLVANYAYLNNSTESFLNSYQD